MTAPNMPNLGAVEAMGKQFNTNVFEGISKKANKIGKSMLPKTGGAAQITNPGGFNFRTTKAATKPTAAPRALGAPTRGSGGPSKPAGGLPAGPGAGLVSTGMGGGANSGTKITVTRVPPTPPAGPRGIAAAPQAIGSGRQPIATPHTPAPRTFSMGGAPAPSGNVIPGKVVSSTTTPLHNPSQFANVTPQSNSPYPTHQHPAGSSNQILPNLTAAQPKPNQFTVGSRNIKGGGIAAMGSQLEAGLSSRPMSVPPKKRRV